MTHAYICDALRTPFGRYGGALSSVRADDLGAIPIRALMARHPNVDWAAVTDVLPLHRQPNRLINLNPPINRTQSFYLPIQPILFCKKSGINDCCSDQ